MGRAGPVVTQSTSVLLTGKAMAAPSSIQIMKALGQVSSQSNIAAS